MPDATASALLSAEARALAALRQVVALYPGRPRLAVPLLTATIEQSRAHARAVGAADMTRETGARVTLLPVRDLDRKYAERAAKGFVKALDVLDARREAGETVRPVATVNAKIELIAATEVPGAFSEERERIERVVIAENPSLVPVLLKRWNARLDACPICRALDGTSRPWGVDFEGKQPGRAHNRCRCYSTFMPIPITVIRQQRQSRRSAWVQE